MIEIYVGTYDGSILSFIGYPHDLSLTASIQPTTNSIKSISIIENQLVAGGFSQDLHVFSLPSLRQVFDARENTGQITRIQRVNSDIVAVGVDDGTVRFWNRKNWNVVQEWRVHKKQISDLKMGGGGKVMLSVGGKKMVIWSAKEMRKKHQYKLQYESNLICVKEDLSYLLIATDRQIKEISIQDNSQKVLFTLELGNKIQTMLLIRDYLLIGTGKGEIKGWKVGNYEATVTFKVHSTRIKDMKTVQLNQNTYLITGTSDGTINVWNLNDFLSSIEQSKQTKTIEDINKISSVTFDHRLICLDCRGIEMSENEKKFFDENEEEEESEVQQKNLKVGQKNVEKKKKIKKMEKAKKKAKFQQNEGKIQKQQKNEINLKKKLKQLSDKKDKLKKKKQTGSK